MNYEQGKDYFSKKDGALWICTKAETTKTSEQRLTFKSRITGKTKVMMFSSAVYQFKAI